MVERRIIFGDCRKDMLEHGPFDMLLADPPYGDTSLDWDRRCSGWLDAAARMLKPTGSLWVFGSMRFFQEVSFDGWALAQDIVWEKHNGSAFHADRFKRVHEHVCQYYRGSWADVYNEVQMTPDATARTVRRKKRRRTRGTSRREPTRATTAAHALCAR